MSNRYELNNTISQLQAALAKAERKLPLSQPVRSADLYTHAITQIKDMTTHVLAETAKAQGQA